MAPSPTSSPSETGAAAAADPPRPAATAPAVDNRDALQQEQDEGITPLELQAELESLRSLRRRSVSQPSDGIDPDLPPSPTGYHGASHHLNLHHHHYSGLVPSSPPTSPTFSSSSRSPNATSRSPELHPVTGPSSPPLASTYLTSTTLASASSSNATSAVPGQPRATSPGSPPTSLALGSSQNTTLGGPSRFPLPTLSERPENDHLPDGVGTRASIRSDLVDSGGSDDNDDIALAGPGGIFGDGGGLSDLFWLPARLHPEIAPQEFRNFIRDQTRPENLMRRSGSMLGRKKSMLSRQYNPLTDSDSESATTTSNTSSLPSSPSTSSTSEHSGNPNFKRTPSRTGSFRRSNGLERLTLNDLQRLETLARQAAEEGQQGQEGEAKLKRLVRRSLSLNPATLLDAAASTNGDQLPILSHEDEDDSKPFVDEADSPLIVPPPGSILRRSARTKIRKNSLPGDGGGHRFGPSKRGPKGSPLNAGHERAESTEGDSESDRSFDLRKVSTGSQLSLLTSESAEETATITGSPSTTGDHGQDIKSFEGSNDDNDDDETHDILALPRPELRSPDRLAKQAAPPPESSSSSSSNFDVSALTSQHEPGQTLPSQYAPFRPAGSTPHYYDDSVDQYAVVPARSGADLPPTPTGFSLSAPAGISSQAAGAIRSTQRSPSNAITAESEAAGEGHPAYQSPPVSAPLPQGSLRTTRRPGHQAGASQPASQPALPPKSSARPHTEESSTAGRQQQGSTLIQTPTYSSPSQQQQSHSIQTARLPTVSPPQSPSQGTVSLPDPQAQQSPGAVPSTAPSSQSTNAPSRAHPLPKGSLPSPAQGAGATAPSPGYQISHLPAPQTIGVPPPVPAHGLPTSASAQRHNTSPPPKEKEKKSGWARLGLSRSSKNEEPVVDVDDSASIHSNSSVGSHKAKKGKKDKGARESPSQSDKKAPSYEKDTSSGNVSASKEKSESGGGFFGGLFGSKKKSEGGDGQSTGVVAQHSGGAGNNGGGVQGAGNNRDASHLMQMPTPPPTATGMLTADGKYINFYRLPIHIERAVYRLSHIKLANPRRPLYEQVLISNLMFWYLGVINKPALPAHHAQQQQKAAEAAEAAARARSAAAATASSSMPPSSGSTGQQGVERNLPITPGISKPVSTLPPGAAVPTSRPQLVREASTPPHPPEHAMGIPPPYNPDSIQQAPMIRDDLDVRPHNLGSHLAGPDGAFVGQTNRPSSHPPATGSTTGMHAALTGSSGNGHTMPANQAEQPPEGVSEAFFLRDSGSGLNGPGAYLPHNESASDKPASQHQVNQVRRPQRTVSINSNNVDPGNSSAPSYGGHTTAGANVVASLPFQMRDKATGEVVMELSNDAHRRRTSDSETLDIISAYADEERRRSLMSSEGTPSPTSPSNLVAQQQTLVAGHRQPAVAMLSDPSIQLDARRLTPPPPQPLPSLPPPTSPSTATFQGKPDYRDINRSPSPRSPPVPAASLSTTQQHGQQQNNAPRSPPLTAHQERARSPPVFSAGRT